eukprot:TRINITY_DN12666_c0_g1_i4.p1 TRINITY_DN12666_c0_g1~~TRINITY_DN12666_c0_g1_i4.p1  ORF type:complete len:323 (+),score=49.96 TRINITY_DN12666_c0_g1_i4:64-969(+)
MAAWAPATHRSCAKDVLPSCNSFETCDVHPKTVGRQPPADKRQGNTLSLHWQQDSDDFACDMKSELDVCATCIDAGEVKTRDIDRHTFNVALKACTRAGDVSRAEDHLFAMKKANIEITTDSVNFVIHACARAGKLETAEEYMFFMEREGVAPDIVSFNSVMNACASRGDLARAQFWFNTMVSRGIRPNEVTFGTVCSVLARHGEAAKVEGLLVAIEASGFALNEYFYASLISACMASEPPDVVRAERALKGMYARGLILRRVRYPLLCTLGKEQATKLIARVLDSSQAKVEGKQLERTQL